MTGSEAPGKWVSKGTLVVCKVSLVGQWVEVRGARVVCLPKGLLARYTQL